MIESGKIVSDSFATNANNNDATANVASYLAQPDTNSIGGSLFNTSLVTSEKMNLTIGDYLSRPKLLYSGSITNSLATPLEFTYVNNFLSSDDIQSKLRFMRLVRGTFLIKLVTTCPPYATGRIALASMYGRQGDYGVSLTDVEINIANLSQKTHTFNDLGSANTSTLSIPFHLSMPYVAMDQPPADISLPRLYLFTQTPLLNTQTVGDVTVSYKIYVSLTDTEVVVPMPVEPSFATFSFMDRHKNNVNNDVTYTSEIESTRNGPISGPASVLASAASLFEQIPVIGRFATATRIGSNAISDIAHLFGFSRPLDEDKKNYPHAVDLAVGVGELQIKSLTTDPKQEVTIDSSVFGETGDSLSYGNTIRRWGYLYRAAWTTAMNTGDTVTAITVMPSGCTITQLDDTTYFAPTPLAYASQLFTGWRGSIEYKLSIPANRFVRGKLRVFWTPSIGTYDLDAVTNNSLSVLIDLTETTEVTLTVPWMCPNLYRHVVPLGGSEDRFNVNGYLYFKVEEPLIANNSSWSAQIIIWHRAGLDFEFVNPSNHIISQTTFNEIPDIGTFASPMTEYSLLAIEPALVENTNWVTYTSQLANDVNPSVTHNVNLLPDMISDNKAALLQIGENIPSLRLVCKRFAPFSTFDQTSNGNNWYYGGMFLPYLGSFEYPQTGTPNEFYTPPHALTPIIYLSRMFAGMRGAMRYAWVGVNSVATANMLVSRMYGIENRIYQVNFQETSDIIAINQHFVGGMTAYQAQHEPLVIEIPFQNYKWFYPTKSLASDEVRYGAIMLNSYSDAVQRPNLIFQSAGEDLQFVIYNGPPIIGRVVNVVTPP
jgi:hypothetical protein